MALGVDQIFAEVCIELGISFLAAVPFLGQEATWPTESKAKYHSLLTRAEGIIYVSEPGYAVWKMQARNCWITDHCDQLLACFDGSAGGTANTVHYAERIGRPIRRINPKDFTDVQQTRKSGRSPLVAH
jgi:uncharacterized phage-like protein YoqJ